MFERLRELRKNANLTQKEVAGIIHYAQRTYSGYERGDHDLPTDVLINLAKYYQTSTDYILGLSDERYTIKHSKSR